MTQTRRTNGQFEKGSHWREPKPYWDRQWCLSEYEDKGRSAADIGKEFGISEAAVLFWLRKHQIPRRDMSTIRAHKHWGAFGADNPMWNRKGEISPNWKGGVTSERQAFYISAEWKKACSGVWERDNATCQRCFMHREARPAMPYHIHHIVSFADKSLRSDLNNLVLLCENCHQFVHSKRNISREHLPKGSYP